MRPRHTEDDRSLLRTKAPASGEIRAKAGPTGSAVLEPAAAREILTPGWVHLALVVLGFAAGRLCFHRLRHEMTPGVIPFGVACSPLRGPRPVTEPGGKTHGHIRCFGAKA